MISIPKPSDVINKRKELLKDKTDKLVTDITDVLNENFDDDDHPVVEFRVPDGIETLVINTVMRLFQSNMWDVRYNNSGRILSFNRATPSFYSGEKD